MHLINLVIVSALIAGIIAVITYARGRGAEDRDLSARLKRFNMSADELRGTRALTCPDCGLLLSAGGHKHTCPNAPLSPPEQAELNTLLSAAKRE